MLEASRVFCDLILDLGRKEKKLEVIRQVLCEIPDFEPYSAFRRLDKLRKNFIDEADIQAFLQDNRIDFTPLFIKDSLMQHYDLDGDGKLIYAEYVLPPCLSKPSTQVPEMPAAGRPPHAPHDRLAAAHHRLRGRAAVAGGRVHAHQAPGRVTFPALQSLRVLGKSTSTSRPRAGSASSRDCWATTTTRSSSRSTTTTRATSTSTTSWTSCRATGSTPTRKK